MYEAVIANDSEAVIVAVFFRVSRRKGPTHPQVTRATHIFAGFSGFSARFLLF